VNLKDIGFYTLSDERCANASETSPLKRGELILTAKCNFRCPYCRSVGGNNIEFDLARMTLFSWFKEGLTNVRFSGGEPTLYPYLLHLVKLCKANGVEHIAISTNGSADIEYYAELVQAGVNDFSVSLDACCAEDGDKMAGRKGAWQIVADNLPIIAKLCYTTVGIVLTEENKHRVNEIARFANDCGVADIRVIPAAQNEDNLFDVHFDDDLIEAHPILAYRRNNLRNGIKVRGLVDTDSNRCNLVLDDVASMQGKHYPCIIYMRESGEAIGKIGAGMREERKAFAENHDTHADPICKANCIDVCVAYNNKYRDLHGK